MNWKKISPPYLKINKKVREGGEKRKRAKTGKRKKVG